MTNHIFQNLYEYIFQFKTGHLTITYIKSNVSFQRKEIKKGWKCQFLIVHTFRATIAIRSNTLFLFISDKFKVLERYKSTKMKLVRRKKTESIEFTQNKLIYMIK